jgi:hypothetical protein
MGNTTDRFDRSSTGAFSLCSPIYDANLRLLEGPLVLVYVHFASMAPAFFFSLTLIGPVVLK